MNATQPSCFSELFIHTRRGLTRSIFIIFIFVKFFFCFVSDPSNSYAPVVSAIRARDKRSSDGPATLNSARGFICARRTCARLFRTLEGARRARGTTTMSYIVVPVAVAVQPLAPDVDRTRMRASAREREPRRCNHQPAAEWI